MKNNNINEREKKKDKIGLGKNKPFTVFFTLEPEHELFNFDSGTGEDARRAVLEADFIVRVLGHELITANLINTIRGLVFASCIGIAASLEKHKPDSEMILDIYPYARLIQPKSFTVLFDTFIFEVQQDAPEIYKSIMEVKADE